MHFRSDSGVMSKIYKHCDELNPRLQQATSNLSNLFSTGYAMAFLSINNFHGAASRRTFLRKHMPTECARRMGTDEASVVLSILCTFIVVRPQRPSRSIKMHNEAKGRLVLRSRYLYLRKYSACGVCAVSFTTNSSIMKMFETLAKSYE